MDASLIIVTSRRMVLNWIAEWIKCQISVYSQICQQLANSFCYPNSRINKLMLCLPTFSDTSSFVMIALHPSYMYRWFCYVLLSDQACVLEFSNNELTGLKLSFHSKTLTHGHQVICVFLSVNCLLILSDLICQAAVAGECLFYLFSLILQVKLPELEQLVQNFWKWRAGY